MQLRILWEEILARFDFVEVLEAPQRVNSNFVRGYTQMPVRLHPRALSITARRRDGWGTGTIIRS